MIQLFPRASGCEWCGGEHPQAQLCHARPGLTRRSFLCLATTAAVAAIVAPKLLIARPEPPLTGYTPLTVFPIDYGPNINQWDAILKEAYLPAIGEQLNSENTLLKFMSMSPAELEAHRVSAAASAARYSRQQKVDRLERRVWKLEQYGVSEARLRRERNRLYAWKYLPRPERAA